MAIPPPRVIPAEKNRGQPARPQISFEIPKSPDFYANRTIHVNTPAKAERMVEFAAQRHLSHIGFAMEYRYRQPGVLIGREKIKHCPRSTQPLVLTMAMAEPTDERAGRLYRFTVDLRCPEVHAAVRTVLRLPCCFVGYDLKPSLQCLFQLNLSAPMAVWDTRLTEELLHLGRHHKRYRLDGVTDEVERIRIGREVSEEEQFRLSLPQICQQYGIPYTNRPREVRLDQTSREQSDDKAFGEGQLNPVVENAVATARLYPHQIRTATANGVLHHLVQVEFPWTVTNARIEWHGVRVDKEKRSQVIELLDGHLSSLVARVKELGIDNVRNPGEVQAWLRRTGLVTVSDQQVKGAGARLRLSQFRGRHPGVDLIRITQRLLNMRTDQILNDGLVGVDGRVHPVHRQLGSHTGRQTSQFPNILGLDSTLRSIVVPDPGQGIGEVDLAQIEVGVAGAVYGDDELVRMFNDGDVYAGMAQAFYHDDLSEPDRSLSGEEFKKKHPKLRSAMKVCVLGLIYGITPNGLARQLDIPVPKAEELQQRFMGRFGALAQATDGIATRGAIQGSVAAVSGIRRYRGSNTHPKNWERRWMTNFPVQAGAAVTFKTAGIRLDREYRRYNARIIVPLHDSFIFESPLEAMEHVANVTEQIMCDAVREYYPDLRPRAVVNIQRPECWSKDGDTDPCKNIERLLTLAIEE